MIRFVVLAAATVAFVALANGSLLTSAQTDPVVSVDALSDSGNTATTVGPIDSSLSLGCGAAFNVDFVIQGVTNIAGFQAELLYDPAVVRVTAVDYNFLLTTTGTLVIDVGNAVPDRDGNFRLAAAMFSTTPFVGASGDGVLARISFQSMRPGSSGVDLTNVKLVDANAVSIPPIDANGFYIGPTNNASVAVISPCVDTDGDGCTDKAEMQPKAYASTGGGRDPLDPWDFYDVSGSTPGVPDGIIDLLNDILGVVQHYAPTGAPPYDAHYDRGPSTGPNGWNMTAPDGSIDLLNDILGVIKQYSHDCR